MALASLRRAGKPHLLLRWTATSESAKSVRSRAQGSAARTIPQLISCTEALMLIHLPRLSGVLLLLGACVFFLDGLSGQEPDGPQLVSPLPTGPATPAPEAKAAETPAVAKGVEVMTRGPVHEAFASPAVEPKPTPVVPKKPPAAIEEMPPEERPEGEVVWIKGYWA